MYVCMCVYVCVRVCVLHCHEGQRSRFRMLSKDI